VWRTEGKIRTLATKDISGAVFFIAMAEVKHERVVRAKTTVWLRTKKFFVSKLSGTSGGRTMMRNALGGSGSQVLNVIMEIVRRYSDKKLATSMEKDVFKIVSKVYLVIQSGALEEEVLNSMREPNYLFAASLMDQLDKRFDKRNPDLVGEFMTRAVHSLRRQMTAHIKEESLQRLDRVLDYCTTQGFLHFFLADEENYADCGVVRRILARMMLQRQSQLDTAMQNLRNLHKNLGIKLRILEPVLRCASTEQFLAQGDSATYFWDWVLSTKDAPTAWALGFHVAVLELKALKDYRVVPIRINALASKYILNPSSSSYLGQLFPSETAAIVQVLEEADMCGEVYPANVLNALDKKIQASLAGLFTEFQMSLDYRNFVREVTQLRKMLDITREDLALVEDGGTGAGAV
jgi:hypothetical protein